MRTTTSSSRWLSPAKPTIISDDSDLLELVTHEAIPVLTPAQFMQRLNDASEAFIPVDAGPVVKR